MMYNRNLLIVGGTGQNVGKTEFVCRLIQKISSSYQVVGLKASAIKPQRTFTSNQDRSKINSELLYKERNNSSHKDTSRMMRAGADPVFFLSCGDNEIGQGYQAFLEKVTTDAIVICESNSLAEVVRPGLFVVIQGVSADGVHPLLPKFQKADLVIQSDGSSGFVELEKITFSLDRGWFVD